jgi:hypothetical protein
MQESESRNDSENRRGWLQVVVAVGDSRHHDELLVPGQHGAINRHVHARVLVAHLHGDRVAHLLNLLLLEQRGGRHGSGSCGSAGLAVGMVGTAV